MRISIRAAVIGLMSMMGASMTSAHAQGAPSATSPAPPPVSKLPIAGIASVTFKSSDLAKSDAYYGGILGLPKAFEMKDRAGNVTRVSYKVNDEQFVELVPGLQPGDNVRQERLVIQATDLKALRAAYAKKGLAPTAIKNGPDGNPTFRITAPNGFPFDFLQYSNNSLQGKLKGKLLADTRLGTHLLHVGTMAKTPADAEFVRDKLEFGRLLPGTRGDYVETPSSDRNLETKNPPLDPNNPATLAQYTREVYGAVYHWSLEMDDPAKVRDTLQARSGFDDVRVRVAAGNTPRWLMHIFDPDGTRTEFMSKDPRPADAVPASIIAPGAGNTEIIKAKKPGVFPWPSAPITATPVKP